MAKIIINDSKLVNGALNITRSLGSKGNIIVEGMLATHKYIELIDRIESERYILNGVFVTKEQFASNDAMIIYTFTADELKIKGGETNLPEDVLKEVERRYFKSEEEELIHKEVYTKWKQEMN